MSHCVTDFLIHFLCPCYTVMADKKKTYYLLLLIVKPFKVPYLEANVISRLGRCITSMLFLTHCAAASGHSLYQSH